MGARLRETLIEVIGVSLACVAGAILGGRARVGEARGEGEGERKGARKNGRGEKNGRG